MSDTIETADAGSIEIDVTHAEDLDSEEREAIGALAGDGCLFLMNGAAHQYVIVGDLSKFYNDLGAALRDAGVAVHD